MSDKSFYIPGLEANDKAQWNRITPAFRILARRDCAPLSDAELHLAHMNPPSWSFSFHEQNEAVSRYRLVSGVPFVPVNGFLNGHRGF